jgi:hypothetical protein
LAMVSCLMNPPICHTRPPDAPGRILSAGRYHPRILMTIAAHLETLLRPKAEERQREHAHTAPGKGKTLLTTLSKVKPESISEPTAEPIHVRKEVAKAAGLSEGTIRKVKVIMQEGTEEQKEMRLGSGDTTYFPVSNTA